MRGLGCLLLAATFVVVLVFPPAAAVMVPLCVAIWVVAYLANATKGTDQCER